MLRMLCLPMWTLPIDVYKRQVGYGRDADARDYALRVLIHYAYDIDTAPEHPFASHFFDQVIKPLFCSRHALDNHKYDEYHCKYDCERPKIFLNRFWQVQNDVYKCRNDRNGKNVAEQHDRTRKPPAQKLSHNEFALLRRISAVCKQGYHLKFCFFLCEARHAEQDRKNIDNQDIQYCYRKK